MVIGGLRGVPRLSHIFVEAMVELGFARNPSYNADPAEGASIVQANQHLGVRWSAARAYLHAVRNRPNLKVVTHAFVRRVLLEGRRAVGVEYDVDGRTVAERAAREVILSASAFNSPRILMLSGIGDPAQLAAANIPVLQANPAVGRNLQDHPATNVKAFVNVHTANLDDNLLGKLKHGRRFAFTHGGEATFVHSAIALIRTRPETRMAGRAVLLRRIRLRVHVEGPQDARPARRRTSAAREAAAMWNCGPWISAIRRASSPTC